MKRKKIIGARVRLLETIKNRGGVVINKGEHSFELHSTLSEIKKVLDKIVEAQQEYDRKKQKNIN